MWAICPPHQPAAPSWSTLLSPRHTNERIALVRKRSKWQITTRMLTSKMLKKAIELLKMPCPAPRDSVRSMVKIRSIRLTKISSAESKWWLHHQPTRLSNILWESPTLKQIWPRIVLISQQVRRVRGISDEVSRQLIWNKTRMSNKKKCWWWS